jgi:hypothetical protein
MFAYKQTKEIGMAEMSMYEITILSATDIELYAYIKHFSLDKDWPLEIMHNGVKYTYEVYWTLPTEMGSGYVQAARYLNEE